jgi:hypothetical protein
MADLEDGWSGTWNDECVERGMAEWFGLSDDGGFWTSETPDLETYFDRQLAEEVEDRTGGCNIFLDCNQGIPRRGVLIGVD